MLPHRLIRLIVQSTCLIGVTINAVLAIRPSPYVQPPYGTRGTRAQQLENVGTKCDWLSFLLGSTPCNGRQTCIVDRQNLGQRKNHECEGSTRTVGDLITLIGLKKESVWKKWAKRAQTPQEEGWRRKRKNQHPSYARSPPTFSCGCTYGLVSSVINCSLTYRLL